MTIDEMIALTPEQQKAWNRLVKAHKDFYKAGGGLHMVLANLYPYNSKYVEKITNPEYEYTTPKNEMFTIGIDVDFYGRLDFKTESFADDWHSIILNAKGKKLLSED